MTVLVLARDFDPTADRVVDALAARQADVFRLNTAWFPIQVRVVAELDGGRWRGSLHTPRGRLDLDSVHAVWYRSPEAYRMPAQLSPAEAQHAHVEAKYGLGGVLASLPALWCNHPGRVADAAYKPLQLVRAARCGLTVPKTVITNDAVPARAFASSGPTVTKLVGGMAIDEDGVRKNVYTRRVTADDLVDLRGIEHTAHLFQRWVPKAREARVIVIGEYVTAAAITAGTAATHVDYRVDYSALSYALETPPPNVVAGIRLLMAELGLVYGALDFVITPSGEWVLLEINPTGQYGFVENATDAPLTAQLADLLVRPVG
ncbi:ATP-grasp ribosomal peptide maturase [Kutzneria sp. CA-103260]|uniref:ATP-grasp ribosomal peptide maturase n=1 Tax=Kutzneria sp. CA-103260 TaxID=2802641 RepID=UPI001BA48336|nr:ATP-grasp ribosomal peptide maturase [Kutzneria sp. CA-103260]QUQ66678.1 RimK-like protein [Kutzneria sp. CA-103260]